MSDERDKIISTVVKIGRYKVELSFDLGDPESGVKAMWEPSMPPKGYLREAHLKKYRESRNFLLDEVGKITGRNVIVVEI